VGISEKALGVEHPDVATSLNKLAGLYRVQGQYAEAEPLYQRSLAIREKALGPEHPTVANLLPPRKGDSRIGLAHPIVPLRIHQPLLVFGRELRPVDRQRVLVHTIPWLRTRASIVIAGLIGDKGFARAGRNATKKKRYLRAGKARSVPFS
jgi:hypothetical protein